MNSHAPPLPVIQPADSERSRLVRRARTLSLLSIGWMTVEAGVAIVAALAAGSVALLGFGLDSLIELASASTILWLYTGSRDGSAAAERRAQQVIAICFAALAVYLAFDAITTLAGGSHPDVSRPGAVVAAAAIVVMPLLARAKDRVATQLGSAATAGDAAQSWLCAIIAAAALVSVLANAAFGWWWLDPVAGLGIAGLAVREGREAWAGELCDECAPSGSSRSRVPITIAAARCPRRHRRVEHSDAATDPALLLSRDEQSPSNGPAHARLGRRPLVSAPTRETLASPLGEQQS